MTMLVPERNRATVSVIIPTSCEARRWPSLQRAIDTARDQEQVDVSLIVVVNGDRVVQQNVDQLRRMAGVTVLYQAQGSAPLAQLLGRQTVRTDFFCFLDDDDEYLPGALRTRLAPMLDDPQLAFVATNGWRNVAGRDRLAVSCGDAVRVDPLYALCNENWLASCAGLYRSASVPTAYFEAPAPYFEWTYLAYKLALALPMAWLDEPTFRINDTPTSLSKSTAYRTAEAGVLLRVLALRPPAPVAAAVGRKIGSTFHDLADDNVELGSLGPAWRYHLLSLRHPGRWRYLLYSRKLLTLALRKASPAIR